ncbi:neuralized-like protein 4 [Littorina saxatilis]|uniref:neuralized-like protein 4 n=1 Tax=Littorina saxatilis TaxID=31220 RepID=UPI0038B4A1E8
MEEFPSSVGQQEPFTFDDNHGVNIVLSHNKQAAERTRGLNHAILMSRNPMKMNVLYEIRVDTWDKSNSRIIRNLGMGVVTQPPDTLILPYWSGALFPATVVCGSSVKLSGSTELKPSSVGSALTSLRTGSSVGVAVDRNHCLQLYVDGQNKGVIAFDLPHNCYALYDIPGYVKPVAALPPKTLF